MKTTKPITPFVYYTVVALTIVGVLAACSAIPFGGPRIEVSSNPLPKGYSIAQSLLNKETIIASLGSLLAVCAALSIVIPVLNRTVPNFLGTGILLGSAIAFWVLAAVFAFISYWLTILVLVGGISSFFVFRHHIRRWAERQFTIDFNKDGSIGT